VWSLRGTLLSDIVKRLEVLLELEKYQEILTLSYDNLYRKEVEQSSIYEYIIIAHLNLGNYKKAIEVIDDVLGKYPQKSQYLYYRSLAYNSILDNKKAISDIQNALTHDPNNADYLYLFAILLFMQNRFIESKKQIENALSIDARKSEYHLLLAKILYELDAKKIASNIVDEILSKEPHNIEALEFKQEFFSKNLIEKKDILKQQLLLKPLDKKSQREIKFIEFYYKYLPWIMGLFIAFSYLTYWYLDQFYFLKIFLLIGFLIIATISSVDWRLNIPFIAVVIGFGIFADIKDQNIKTEDYLYIVVLSIVLHFIFLSVYKLIKRS